MGPFFCGTAPQCWDPGSEWALAQAKSNLVNQYLLLGITEELDNFIEVLEALLPNFFTGATNHIKKTRHKDELSEETMKKMKSTKIWKLENEFYNFAMKNFRSVRTAVLEQKKSKNNFFKYEKIRPKK